MNINSSGITLNKIDRDEFYISLNENGENYFSHDSVFTIIENKISNLYDLIQDKLFSDYKTYYNELDSLPDWVLYGGLDSDSPIDKLSFEKKIIENNSEKIYRHLYLIDFNNLVSALSQRISITRNSFITFYKSLSEIDNTSEIDNDIVCVTGLATITTFSSLHNVFISIQSIFDLLTKIAYELEMIKTDFSKYQKLSSSKILLGNKKKLKHEYSSKSIFKESKLINKIMNIRNEIIHNSSWEINPKIFIKVENKEITERWIYFPDTENGNFISYGNRKRFFSQEEKINEKLPLYTLKTLDLINYTIEDIIKNNT